MKKSVRKIIINEQKWTWVVESLNYCTIKEVRIYSPEKKMFRLKPEDISTIKTYEEYAGLWFGRLIGKCTESKWNSVMNVGDWKDLPQYHLRTDMIPQFLKL